MSYVYFGQESLIILCQSWLRSRRLLADCEHFFLISTTTQGNFFSFFVGKSRELRGGFETTGFCFALGFGFRDQPIYFFLSSHLKIFFFFLRDGGLEMSPRPHSNSQAQAIRPEQLGLQGACHQANSSCIYTLITSPVTLFIHMFFPWEAPHHVFNLQYSFQESGIALLP